MIKLEFWIHAWIYFSIPRPATIESTSSWNPLFLTIPENWTFPNRGPSRTDMPHFRVNFTRIDVHCICRFEICILIIPTDGIEKFWIIAPDLPHSVNESSPVGWIPVFRPLFGPLVRNLALSQTQKKRKLLRDRSIAESLHDIWKSMNLPAEVVWCVFGTSGKPIVEKTRNVFAWQASTFLRRCLLSSWKSPFSSIFFHTLRYVLVIHLWISINNWFCKLLLVRGHLRSRASFVGHSEVRRLRSTAFSWVAFGWAPFWICHKVVAFVWFPALRSGLVFVKTRVSQAP